MTKLEAANRLQDIVDSGVEINAGLVDALILAVNALRGYNVDDYQPEPEEHTGCTEDACPIKGVEQDD